MSLTKLLLAAAIAYDYDDTDKATIRHMAMTDKAALATALSADPWLPWVAYAHGITSTRPVDMK